MLPTLVVSHPSTPYSLSRALSSHTPAHVCQNWRERIPGEQTTDLDVPAHFAVGALRRQIGDVVDVGVLVHLLGTDEAHVEFSWEIGELGVTITVVGELRRKLVAEGPCVDKLLGVDARNGVAHQVAHVIHT